MTGPLRDIIHFLLMGKVLTKEFFFSSSLLTHHDLSLLTRNPGFLDTISRFLDALSVLGLLFLNL